MNSLEAHLFAIATPVLASVSQIIIKWQVNQVGHSPDNLLDKALFLVEFIFRPWILFAISATFLSGLTWILAMTKLDISYAYPYVALTFVVVPLLGFYLFGEAMSPGKILGGVFILTGIFVVMVKG